MIILCEKLKLLHFEGKCCIMGLSQQNEEMAELLKRNRISVKNKFFTLCIKNGGLR